MAWTMWPKTVWLWPTTTMIFNLGVVVDDNNIMVLGFLVHGIQIFHLIFSWRRPRSIELLGTCKWVPRYFDNLSLHLLPWQYGMWFFVLWHPPFCTLGYSLCLCYTQNSQQVKFVISGHKILGIHQIVSHTLTSSVSKSKAIPWRLRALIYPKGPIHESQDLIHRGLRIYPDILLG